MYWKNDGAPAEYPTPAENMNIKRFPEIEDAKNRWLDIARYMDSVTEELIKTNPSFFEETMANMPNFKEDGCFFVTVNGVPAATVTVICDRVRGSGYIHMVCAKPEYRGFEIGHLLNRIAEYALKSEGMETAHLTTDDFRIPAIKSYLAAGYTPDLVSEPDFSERWEKIFKIIKENKPQGV